MSSTYNSRIITKTDTYDNWTAANPVLLNGELVAVTGYTYVFDEQGSTGDFGVQFKFGDGATAFNDLPFVNEDIVGNLWGCADTMNMIYATLQEHLQNSTVVYVGSTTPSNDIGSNGDLYIQLS